MFRSYRVKRQNRESIEPEEILLDAENLKVMDEKFERPISLVNFVVFGVIIFVVLLGLWARSFWMQIVQGSHYTDLAQGNRIRLYYKPAPRGVVYDRSFKQLVFNVPVFDLMVVPGDLPKKEEARKILMESLVRILGEKEKVELEERFNGLNYKSWQPVLLKNAVDHDLIVDLEMFIKDTAGLSLVESATRQYSQGYYFSHFVGYTGKGDSMGMEGKAGIEGFYDEILSGRPGREEMEVDSLGKFKRLIALDKGEAGKGLVLSVDGDLQMIMYDSLNNMMSKTNTKGASAVAMDPRDGRILAMVSLPSFDNNLFTQSGLKTGYEDLFNRSDRPLFNRAISGQYPPGSTIKPLVAVAALNEGVIGENYKVSCPGHISIGSFQFNDWRAHGIVSVKDAIAQSCNVFFYYLGGGFGDFKGLGIDRLVDYYRLFGLGSLSGVDLSGEKSGFVPSPEWKKEERNEPWYIGDTYHASIGQGDVLATPLQLAKAISAVANGGTLFTPEILFKIVDTERNVEKIIEPKVERKDFIDEKSLRITREGMRLTVTGGSAAQLNSLPVEVAGKTGTAQYANNEKTHAWFVGFAPYDNPQIVLTILVEGGGEGHSTAVPVAKEILSWYYDNGRFEKINQ